jgi:BMFP domain-containing protein YqiC
MSGNKPGDEKATLTERVQSLEAKEANDEVRDSDNKTADNALETRVKRLEEALSEGGEGEGQQQTPMTLKEVKDAMQARINFWGGFGQVPLNDEYYSLRSTLQQMEAELAANPPAPVPAPVSVPATPTAKKK